MPREERKSNFAYRTYALRFDATFITTVTILAALAFLVYRTIENERLKSELAGLRGGLARLSGDLAGLPTLQPGDIVPVVVAKNLRGEERELTYNRAIKNLVFVFSVECGSCIAELPQWNQIARQYKAHKFQVVGLAVNKPELVKQTLAGKKIEFEILIPDDFAIRRVFRAISLPLTVLVSSQGRVELAEYGVLTEKGQQKILSPLQIQ